MIIYGWNSKVLKESPFPNQKCISCGNETTHIVVTGSYAHIFWIPLFPYRKSLHIVCSHCDYVTTPRQVSDEVRSMAKSLKKSVKLPFWMFAGVGIVAIIFMVGIFNSFMDSQQVKDYLNNPEVDDIYHLYDDEEASEYKYYLWKVIEVNGDSINISPNSFHYNYQATRLEPEDGFYDIYYTLHKDAIKTLYEDDVIRKIQRGFGAGLGFEREIEYVPELPAESNEN